MLNKILSGNFINGELLSENISSGKVNKLGKSLKKNGFIKPIKRTSERGCTWERWNRGNISIIIQRNYMDKIMDNWIVEGLIIN